MTGLVIALGVLVVLYGLGRLQKAVYKRWWHKGLRFDLRFSQSAVFEGEKTAITESLTCGKALPLPWEHVSYSISRAVVFLDAAGNKTDRGELRNLLYTAGRGKTMSRRFSVLCSKRGYYTINELSIASNNLMMTFGVSRKLDIHRALTVYPRLVEYPESMIPFLRISGEASSRQFINPDPFAFKGIREYRPNDSFRQINWGATAKTGSLMSNIHDFTVSQDITILLNLQDYSIYQRDFVHEEAIRLAAFFCRKYAAMGIPVGLVCPQENGKYSRIISGLSGAHLEMLYTALAHIDLNASIGSIADYLGAEAGKAFILISSYHQEDLYDKYDAARKEGSGAFWIVPHSRSDSVRADFGEDVVKWEVCSNVSV